MELSEVVGTQLAFHGLVVGFVVILAVLVFVFGFKTAEEPPFDKLSNSSEDRKPAGKKRNKVKDKKSQSNGHVTAVTNDKSEAKTKTNENAKTSTPKAGSKAVKDDKRDVEKVIVKETNRISARQDKKQQKTEVGVKSALKENKANKENKAELKSGKKNEPVKKDTQKPANKNKGKENVEVKNKKNTEKNRKNIEEKPVDFDEGEWEQASYRKDKKKNRLLNAEDDPASGDKISDKKDSSSPDKKKTSKPVAVENIETDAEKKPAKKDKKENAKSPQPTESVTESVENKGDKVGVKKNKKKGGKEDAENVDTIEKVEAEVVAKAAEVAAPQKVQDPVNKSIDENIAFDDFADSCPPEKWKEPKTSKKSNNKKKVRKDQ